MKKQIKTIAGLTTSFALISSATAATFVWTGGGVVNDIDDPDNWDQLTAPSSGIKIGTTNAADIVRFDSESATLPTANIEFVRISSGNQRPNVELLNGTLNLNRSDNWAHAGTSFTIGDGDLTTLAQANFTNASANLDRFGASSYEIYSDGTLQINPNFTYSSTTNTVINLIGGTVNSDGHVLAGLTNQANNYVSFQAAGSSFTASYGGQLVDFAAVQAQDGDSFRTGGAFSGSLTYTDNGSSFTVFTAPVPEPSSTALLGLGGLALILRRRK